MLIGMDAIEVSFCGWAGLFGAGLRLERAGKERGFERGHDFVRLHVTALEDPVGPGVERGQFLLGFAALVARHHDDEKALQFVLAADFAQEVQAVNFGRFEVDDQRVEGKSVQDVQAFGAVGDGFHPVAGGFHFLAPAVRVAVSSAAMTSTLLGRARRLPTAGPSMGEIMAISPGAVGRAGAAAWGAASTAGAEPRPKRRLRNPPRGLLSEVLIALPAFKNGVNNRDQGGGRLTVAWLSPGTCRLLQDR